MIAGHTDPLTAALVSYCRVELSTCVYHCLCVSLCMLKPVLTKKRKRSDSGGRSGRTVAGSAFAACPICSKQVPLLTINIHLGGKDCLQACSSSTQQDKEHTSGQHQRDQQTAAPVIPSPAVLQLEPISTDLPAIRSHHAADAVQCAALQSTAGQLLVPTTICKTSAVAPDDERRQSSQKTAVLLHSPSPAATSSLCNHQLSEVLQSSSSDITELSLIPHAELTGEYRILDFVTAQEETDIVRVLDAAAPQWKDSAFNGKHRGKRWGAEMDLNKRTVVEGSTAMPPVLTALITRMQQIPLLQHFQPNEANAIDYRKGLGHWLKPHVDDRQLSTDKIVTLSLVGSAVMTFSCKKKKHDVCVELPARTLQVITKEARYMYTHGIAKQALTQPRRVSVTFRQSPFKS